MSDPTYEELVAENAALREQIANAGTGVMVGPGTPEHFYAVGGVGDVVTDASGEPLLNAQTGAPIIQEHPSVEADAQVAAARTKVEKAGAALAGAEAALADAEAAVAAADARFDEIVADLASQAAPSEG